MHDHGAVRGSIAGREQPVGEHHHGLDVVLDAAADSADPAPGVLGEDIGTVDRRVPRVHAPSTDIHSREASLVTLLGSNVDPVDVVRGDLQLYQDERDKQQDQNR